jgi:hypothetical protein
METTPQARSTSRVRRDEAGGKRPDGHSRLTPRFRPDPSRIRVAPTDEALTGYAGLVPFAQFLQKQGVDRSLHEHFDALKGGHRMRYWVADVMRLVMDSLVVGETRVYGLEAVASDALVERLAGGRVPSIDIVYDDLRRFRAPERNALLALVIEHGFADLKGRSFKRVHLDIDTTVEPLFGHQEGALAGPNPKYHGRPSYHPLLARIAESNTIVGARLRPGNTGFGRADVGWLRSVIRRVRKELGRDVTIVVRIDAAADSVEVMKALDKLKVIFVIKAKMTPDLCRAVAATTERAWRTVDRDADGRPMRQVTTVEFGRAVWDEHGVRYSVVAVREREKEGGRKLYLWDEDDWSAHAFLTNTLEGDEEEIADEYDGRAGIEPLIGQLKLAYGMGHVPTTDFDANHTMFLLKLLTYNLIQRYVRAHHPKLLTWHLGWVRRVLFRVPGKLVFHGRQWTVRVPTASRLARMLH